MNNNEAIKETPQKFALAVLVILHAVGVFGLNMENFREDFLGLIWINLLFVFSIVLSLHPKWDSKYLLFVPVIFLFGMVIEIIGVKTDQIFGAYSYTNRLGTLVGGVPLIIGMNWVIVTYCAGMVSIRFFDKKIPRVILGAGLMVLLDVVIEPFAIKYGLWEWLAGHPPLRNWAGWIVASLATQYFFHTSFRRRTGFNPVGFWAYIILLVFFLADWII